MLKSLSKNTKGESTGIFGPDPYSSEGVDYSVGLGGISPNLSGPPDILSTDVLMPKIKEFTIQELERVIEESREEDNDVDAQYYQMILDEYKKRIREAKSQFQMIKRGSVMAGINSNKIKDPELRAWLLKISKMSPEQRYRYFERQRLLKEKKKKQGGEDK